MATGTGWLIARQAMTAAHIPKEIPQALLRRREVPRSQLPGP